MLAPNALIYYTQYVLINAQGAGVIPTVGFTYDIRDGIKWAGGLLVFRLQGAYGFIDFFDPVDL